MYCTKCGKSNNLDATFCAGCGAGLKKSTPDPLAALDLPNKEGRGDYPPYPYAITPTKYLALAISTLGLYNAYWFYRHFKSFKSETQWDINPFLRSMFWPLTSYSLFSRVSKAIEAYDKRYRIAAGLFAAIIIGVLITQSVLQQVVFFAALISPILICVPLLVGMIPVLLLLQVQKRINYYWTQRFGPKLVYSPFRLIDYVAIVAGVLMLIQLFASVAVLNKMMTLFKSAYTQESAGVTTAATPTPTPNPSRTLSEPYVKSAAEWMNKGEYVKARDDLEKAIEIDPANATAYVYRGQMYHAAKLTDMGIADLTKAIDLNPSDSYPYVSRANMYASKKQYDMAIADLSKAIELVPNSDHYYILRGGYYVQNAEYDKAIADFNTQMGIAPNTANHYYNRGIAWFKKGDYDKAIEDYTKSMELLGFEHADLYGARGQAWEAKQEYAKAKADYVKADELIKAGGAISTYDEDIKRLEAKMN